MLFRCLPRRLAGSLIVLVAAVLVASVHAGTISLAWDALEHPNLVGYRVYYGPVSGSYAAVLDTGISPEVVINGLPACTLQYVAVKARGSDGAESSVFSNEISGWPRPEIVAAPSQVADRATTTDVMVDGSNFMPGAAVTLSVPTIVVDAVTVVACDRITLRVTVPAGVATGPVGVTVTNPDLVTGSVANAFTVANAAPTGQIVAPTGPLTIEQGDSLDFAATGSDPDGNTPLSWTWDFGDATIPSSTQQNPTGVRFDNAGTFQVRLTVRDSLGTADPEPATLDVTVTAAQAPTITAVQAVPVAATTATIAWTTDEPADGQVLYRPLGDSVWRQTLVETDLVTDHSIDLVGLAPSTVYEFSVRSADAGGAASTQAGTPFTTTASAFAYLRIEAESAALGAPAQAIDDAAAFAATAVRLAPGTPQGTPGSPSGSWSYGVDLPSAGSWRVWLRLRGQNSSSDSWLHGIDGEPLQSVAPAVHGAWSWVAGVTRTLSSGSHVLTLGGQDAGAQIDRLLFTNDPDFVPTESPGGDNQPPPPATGVVATPGDAQNVLSWTNPVDAGPLRVVVRFAVDGSTPANPYDGALLLDRAATPAAADGVGHAGLVNGTTYRYAVFLLDAWGNVSSAATASATPQAAVEPLGDVQNLHRTDIAVN